MVQTRRIGPVLLFVAVVTYTLTSDLENKLLYIAANAIVVVAVVAVVERWLKGRPDA